jgi:hypothetical protein
MKKLTENNKPEDRGLLFFAFLQERQKDPVNPVNPVRYRVLFIFFLDRTTQESVGKISHESLLHFFSFYFSQTGLTGFTGFLLCQLPEEAARDQSAFSGKT